MVFDNSPLVIVLFTNGWFIIYLLIIIGYKGRNLKMESIDVEIGAMLQD